MIYCTLYRWQNYNGWRAGGNGCGVRLILQYDSLYRQWEVVAIVVVAAILKGMVFDRDALRVLCCRGCGRVALIVLARGMRWAAEPC